MFQASVAVRPSLTVWANPRYCVQRAALEATGRATREARENMIYYNVGGGVSGIGPYSTEEKNENESGGKLPRVAFLIL